MDGVYALWAMGYEKVPPSPFLISGGIWMEEQQCESCGMPMEKAEDFGGGIVGNPYCLYCSNYEGNLKSYDEIHSGFTDYLVNSEGMTPEEAKKLAAEMMSKLPAWKDYKKK